jgi:hypothetical protein
VGGGGGRTMALPQGLRTNRFVCIQDWRGSCCVRPGGELFLMILWGGVAGWERARAEREHAAEAQAAWAVGLHGRGGALLGVASPRGEGEPPAPGSLSPLENGSVPVLRFTSPLDCSFTLLPSVGTMLTRPLPDAGRGAAAPVPSGQAAHRPRPSVLQERSGWGGP